MKSKLFLLSSLNDFHKTQDKVKVERNHLFNFAWF